MLQQDKIKPDVLLTALNARERARTHLLGRSPLQICTASVSNTQQACSLHSIIKMYASQTQSRKGNKVKGKKKGCLTFGVTRKENNAPSREERHLLGLSMMLISRSKGRSCPHFHCHRTLRRHRQSVSNPDPTQLRTLLQALIEIKHEISLPPL